ncbi:uncharacterized protein LOC119400926 [Rhipicephalus sanguineus]|uniref:uncharacterized protein LOC119400926 n=1 Tax=Rhipicephalus sanguineus TaxID=34632 RepID=UPI0020C471EA|nr:uncharacterized protein LOC119400926 [Rhipicephalus sanguineus]
MARKVLTTSCQRLHCRSALPAPCLRGIGNVGAAVSGARAGSCIGSCLAFGCNARVSLGRFGRGNVCTAFQYGNFNKRCMSVSPIAKRLHSWTATGECRCPGPPEVHRGVLCGSQLRAITSRGSDLRSLTAFNLGHSGGLLRHPPPRGASAQVHRLAQAEKKKKPNRYWAKEHAAEKCAAAVVVVDLRNEDSRAALPHALRPDGLVRGRQDLPAAVPLRRRHPSDDSQRGALWHPPPMGPSAQTHGFAQAEKIRVGVRQRRTLRRNVPPRRTVASTSYASAQPHGFAQAEKNRGDFGQRGTLQRNVPLPQRRCSTDPTLSKEIGTGTFLWPRCVPMLRRADAEQRDAGIGTLVAAPWQLATSGAVLRNEGACEPKAGEDNRLRLLFLQQNEKEKLAYRGIHLLRVCAPAWIRTSGKKPSRRWAKRHTAEKCAAAAVPMLFRADAEQRETETGTFLWPRCGNRLRAAPPCASRRLFSLLAVLPMLHRADAEQREAGIGTLIAAAWPSALLWAVLHNNGAREPEAVEDDRERLLSFLRQNEKKCCNGEGE